MKHALPTALCTLETRVLIWLVRVMMKTLELHKSDTEMLIKGGK